MFLAPSTWYVANRPTCLRRYYNTHLVQLPSKNPWISTVWDRRCRGKCAPPCCPPGPPPSTEDETRGNGNAFKEHNAKDPRFLPREPFFLKNSANGRRACLVHAVQKRGVCATKQNNYKKLPPASLPSRLVSDGLTLEHD